MGDQTLRPTRSSRARIARVSVETASPIRRTRSSFQVAPIPTACGNTVAGPIQATPCRASWPVRKAATPRRSTAGANWWRNAIFSSGVSRWSRSSMRFASGSRGSRKGGVGGVCAVTVGIPLRWSGEALSKRFDAHSTVGWVSRDHGATDPFPHRHTSRDSDGRKGVFRSSTPPRNLGIDPCAPPVVHLTSQQHRSASTAEGNASRAHLPPLFISSIASAQPVPLKTPQPTATAGCPGVRHEGLTQ